MNKDKNMELEFENLSYQDFWENKILLIEYDLTPEEILEKKVGFCDQLIINGQKYNIFKASTINHKLYQMVIIFSSQNLSYNRNLTPKKQKVYEVLKKLPCNWKFKQTATLHSTTGKSSYTTQIYYLSYTHPISLSWEEIIDKLYLDFIIKSTSEYLNQYLQQNFNNINNDDNIKIKLDHINICSN